MNFLTIFVSLIVLVILSCLAVGGWFYRYRLISFTRHEHTPDMDSRSPEGYTDKPFYHRGETIIFFLRSDSTRNTLSIRRVIKPFEFKEIHNAPFARIEQSIPSEASEVGCGWTPSMTIPTGEEFQQGYFQALLTDEETQKTFEIYFIIGEKKPASIVSIAPISTWTAYNPWGGKSLYQNKFENKTVYYVSTERPNTAFERNHAIHVEANIFNWFASEYPNVSIIPDYLLEETGILDECELLILSYHCEYISNLMHRAIRAALHRGVSIISMGANQLYWVVRWNTEHTKMECRKDLTFFNHSISYGGMWKHHFQPQQKYLGGRYNGLGMFTYAPYKILANENHWILAGLKIQNDQIFGMKSIDGRPISGQETDKTTKPKKNLEIIARGMNSESKEIGTIYDPNDPRWNGSGGADISILYLRSGAAVLNTASIHSGAGLGVDQVFTGLIKNFVARIRQKNLPKT